MLDRTAAKLEPAEFLISPEFATQQTEEPAYSVWSLASSSSCPVDNDNNGHLDGLASCKRSSRWTWLLPMIIQMDRPLASQIRMISDQNSNKRFALFTWSSSSDLQD